MYPFIRMIAQMWRHRSDPPLGLVDTHESEHLCWPWDLDMWRELNNGRALTLYDLGRIPMAGRAGLITVLRRERWALTMAGAMVRYRRRVRLFARIRMKSRVVCWDHRFIYLEQGMWLSNGECASHVLYRSAVTDRNGIVPPDRVLAALGREGEASPPFPQWIASWVATEDQRPWPPMQP